MMSSHPAGWIGLDERPQIIIVTQVTRQRKEILQLQRAGISTASAEALLERMQATINGLCMERDRLRKEEPRERRVLGGRRW